MLLRLCPSPTKVNVTPFDVRRVSFRRKEKKEGRKDEDRGNHFSVFVAPAGPSLSFYLSVCQRRRVNDRWDEEKDSVSEQFSPLSRPRFRSLKDISVLGYFPTK